MTAWKENMQKEWEMPDGTVWAGKVKEPVTPGSSFYIGNSKKRYRILDVDEEQNRMLVIAADVFCEKQFNENLEDCTWERSSLRNWLNHEFLEIEFSKEEAEAICDSGNDRVFLLSIEEFERYKQWLEIKKEVSTTWWLRTQGESDLSAAVVSIYYSIYKNGDKVSTFRGVRPAMWIDLNAEYVSACSVVNDQNERLFVNPEIIIKDGELIHASQMSENVVLPSCVRKIRENAFRHCQKLSSITWTEEPVIEINAFIDCPKLKLPSDFYTKHGMQIEHFAKYMPDDIDLLVEILLQSRGFGAFWDVFIRRLSKENAIAVADLLLERAKQKAVANNYERVLRFAFACAPVLGEARMKAIHRYIRFGKYTSVNWQPALEREIKQVHKPDDIVKVILDKEVVSEKIIGSQWREYDHLPSFASIMYAVGDYAAQYAKDERIYSSTDMHNCEYRKNPEADAYAAGMDHRALMNLLWKWATWIDARWFAPYAAFADDIELAVLIENMNQKGIPNQHGYDADWIKGAILLNDTVTAQRFADEAGFLGRYAQMRSAVEDEIRDQSISDFGLDEHGKRYWTLDGKQWTAVVNNDLQVILMDESGTRYTDFPKSDTDPLGHIRVNLEYTDLKENVISTAKLRNIRLFEDFLSGRKRDAAGWIKGYMKKPVLRILGKLIIWEQDGHTFTLDDTGQPVTAEGTSYTITDAPIAVAHPMEMRTDSAEAWRKYYTDRTLKQPFEQAWEPVKDPASITEDRYKGYLIPNHMLQKQKKHGIMMDWNGILTLTGFHVDNVSHGDASEIVNIRYDEWNRQTNHIIAYLDKCIITGKIKEDDIQVIRLLDGFTAAQLTEFIDLANAAHAYNVLGELLEYKNSHCGNYDAMAEFTLDL